MTAEPPAVTVPAPTVEDLLISEGYLRASTPLTWFRRALLVGEAARDIVQDMTVGQRDNPLWCQLRKLRLAASNFGAVLSAVRRNKYVKIDVKAYTSHNLLLLNWGLYFIYNLCVE